MDILKIKGIIESLLFAYGDPMSIRDLQKVLNLPSKEIKNAIDQLQKDYEHRQSGIKVLKLEDSYQLASVEENEKYIRMVLDKSKKKSLSGATLETLTIIAYLQPVTRIEIEEIRGVKCDRVIKNLLDHKLIYEAGKLDKIGRPILYRTTDNFLKLMDIESIKQLPDIDLRSVQSGMEMDNDENRSK